MSELPFILTAVSLLSCIYIQFLCIKHVLARLAVSESKVRRLKEWAKEHTQEHCNQDCGSCAQGFHIPYIDEDDLNP